MLYTSGTPQAALYDENNYEQKKRSANIFTIQPSLFYYFTLPFLFNGQAAADQIFFPSDPQKRFEFFHHSPGSRDREG
jgi:hypothetical protein